MSAEVAAAVAEAHRGEWSRVLTATVRLTRDLDLAEECTQDAYVQALQTWTQTGIPDRPGAWLTTIAQNRARDLLRRESVLRRALPLLVADGSVPGPEDALGIDDDRLRLVFTCCHPALSRDAQVALTLRLVCGLPTAEVARAFLVPESTMAARITRAKKKIIVARIPYRVPSPDQLAERVSAVLEVLHLIFTTGHTAPIGAHLVRRDLVDSAINLARLLHLLMPTDTEISALLALLLLIDARRDTRLSADEVRRRGRYRCRARRGADVAGYRLVGDRRFVRRPAPTVAIAGGRAQPCGRDRAAGRAAGRPGRTGAAARRAGAGDLRLPLRRSRRLPAATGPMDGGGADVPGGPDPHRQRRRTHLPHRTTWRGPGRCVNVGSDRAAHLHIGGPTPVALGVADVTILLGVPDRVPRSSLLIEPN